jgi:cyclohexadieny/prephenate dehydrogenase
MLGRFTEDLTALQRAIRWGEGDKLYDWFERTREIREGVVDMRQAGSFNPAERKDDPETE